MPPQKSLAKSYNKIAREYIQNHASDGLSIPSLKRFVAYLPDRATILDVGCGGGQDSKFLTDRGYAVFGIDVSKEMIKFAKKMAPGAMFHVGDVMALPARVKYDGTWCCRVFHHISLAEQDAFLRKLHTLLKKGGVLYLTSVVSNTRTDYEAFDSGNDQVLKKRLTTISFKKLLAKHGFELLTFRYWVGKKGMEIFVRKV